MSLSQLSGYFISIRFRPAFPESERLNIKI